MGATLSGPKLMNISQHRRASAVDARVVLCGSAATRQGCQSLQTSRPLRSTDDLISDLSVSSHLTEMQFAIKWATVC